MIAESTAPTRRPAPVTIPPSLFGIGFGLAGLAGCWQAAARATGAPGWAGWAAAAIGILAAVSWLVTGVAWVARLARGPVPAATQLRDPLLGPFVSVLPITGMLLAVQLYPSAPAAGRIGFGVFAAATLLLGGWLTGEWISAPPGFGSLHPGYVLPTVTGGLLAAQGAAAVGWHGLARGLFGLGLVCWFLLGSVILARLLVRPALPAALAPLLAIQVAPPAVAGIAYAAVSNGRYDAVAWALAGYAALMALVQVRFVPLYRRARFGPAFWSFTFSYAAAATLAVRWIGHEQPAGAAAWTWAVLAGITGLVAAIAGRTAVALARGQFLPLAPGGAGPREPAGEEPPAVTTPAVTMPAQEFDPRGVAGFAALGR